LKQDTCIMVLDIINFFLKKLCAAIYNKIAKIYLPTPTSLETEKNVNSRVQI
jgi:hypothetical protein